MIYDITPPLFEGMAHWPGDHPLRREVMSDRKRGDPVTLSALHATAHLGAHADAPCHMGEGAPGIDQVPLELFVGPCQVMNVKTPQRTAVTRDQLTAQVLVPRLLLATDTFLQWDHFHEDFAGLSADLIEFLHQKNVKLVGIDTPSIDVFDAKDLPAHRACLQWNMAVLEGLDLHKIPDGVYELIALPLKLVGFDASPVRAILRPL